MDKKEDTPRFDVLEEFQISLTRDFSNRFLSAKNASKSRVTIGTRVISRHINEQAISLNEKRRERERKREMEKPVLDSSPQVTIRSDDAPLGKGPFVYNRARPVSLGPRYSRATGEWNGCKE